MKEHATYETDGNDSLSDMENDCNFLMTNVPTEGEIIYVLRELAGKNDKQSVLLVPIRSFLQTKLKVTSHRLSELINDNKWISLGIDHIQALQEVSIMEEFVDGNIEDSKLKWLIWGILGEFVDLATPRANVTTNAESTLMEINK